jgi:hypothetical protein
VDHAAFGGPIIYGHDQVDPVASKNIYFYQTQSTDAVFKSLNSDQAAKALIAKAPSETAVQLQGATGKFSGIRVAELAAEQKVLVEKTLALLLAPYRREDIDEVMQILQASGGVDQLHMSFYSQEDLGGDRTWDILARGRSQFRVALPRCSACARLHQHWSGQKGLNLRSQVTVPATGRLPEQNSKNFPDFCQ